MPLLIDGCSCVILFTVELNSNFHFFFADIQEWASNNETRAQIEDTVLYGYYSKCILLYTYVILLYYQYYLLFHLMPVQF